MGLKKNISKKLRVQVNEHTPILFYKISEITGYYDSSRSNQLKGANRILGYRLGLSIYEREEIIFENFKKFHLARRKYLKTFLLLLITCFLTITAITFIYAHILIAVVLSLLSIWFIRFFSLELGRMKKNWGETNQFFTYIDPVTKKANFDAFESLSLNDEESAREFYLKMVRFEHFEIQPLQPPKAPQIDVTILSALQLNMETAVEVNFETPFKSIIPNSKGETLEPNTEHPFEIPNRTVSLLTIDFLLGGIGTLEDALNKATHLKESGLTKMGCYRVFGKIIGKDKDNVKKYCLKGHEIYNDPINWTPQMENAFEEVREIFKEAKLPARERLVADHIHKMKNSNKS